MRQRQIICDPGHGGRDFGATRGELAEKKVVLDIGRRVCRLQTIQGDPSCVMTRYADHFVPLKSRVETERWAARDICLPSDTVFVSIHVNSSEANETKAEGLSVFHYHRSSDGEDLAKAVFAEIMANVDIPRYNAGVLADRDFLGHTLYVLKQTASPACLIELGFINNVHDRKLLIDPEFRENVAVAIWDGTRSYFEGG